MEGSGSGEGRRRRVVRELEVRGKGYKRKQGWREREGRKINKR